MRKTMLSRVSHLDLLLHANERKCISRNRITSDVKITPRHP